MGILRSRAFLVLGVSAVSLSTFNGVAARADGLDVASSAAPGVFGEEVCQGGAGGLRVCVSAMEPPAMVAARALPAQVAGSSAACDSRTRPTPTQVLSRTHACVSTIMHVKVMKGTKMTGSVDFQVRGDTYTNLKALGVNVDWTLTRFNVQGDGEYAGPALDAHRVVLTKNIDQKVAAKHGMINDRHRYSAVLTGTPAAGQVETMTPAADLGFWMEGLPQPAWLTKKYSFAAARCDRVYDSKRTPAGCVTPWGAPPVLKLSRSGNYVAYYDHVSRAIKSGLPSVLTKDSTRQAANNRAACGGRTRPTGMQCDEYPFASTAEGAAKNPKQPRTFPGCSINEKSATGPYGFSVCMISATSNAAGGGQLGSFYQANRVLDQDFFKVQP